MPWAGCSTIRLMIFLALIHAAVLCSPVVGFLSSSQLHIRPNIILAAPGNRCQARATHMCRTASQPRGAVVGAFGASTVTTTPRTSRRATWLWMSSPAPPVKPPKKRGWGGGGRGDDLYVRELVEPEKSEILNSWRSYAMADGGEKFTESIDILDKMISWRSGVVAARKRRFALVCCKGTAVQAVACVQIAPNNDDIRSFMSKQACMSLCLLNVDPASPQFKAGAHLCKEIKEIGRLEKMAVDFQPIKDIYSGRFYAATLTM